MHQSKKEQVARQWNQKASLELHDKLEEEEALLYELISREAGITGNVDISKKK